MSFQTNELHECGISKKRRTFCKFLNQQKSILSEKLFMNLVHLCEKYPVFLCSRQVEVKLLQRPMKEFGSMNRTEFNESMDALSPLVNEKLRHKLFSESEQHFSEGRKVSVARLARILYLKYLVWPSSSEKSCLGKNDIRFLDIITDENDFCSIHLFSHLLFVAKAK